MPTIDLQITARHETARVADAEHRRASVLFGHAQLPEHVLRRPVASALWVFLEERFYHRCGDVTRADGVDPDPVAAPLACQISGELEDGSFGGVIGGADETLWIDVNGRLGCLVSFPSTVHLRDWRLSHS